MVKRNLSFLSLSLVVALCFSLLSGIVVFAEVSEPSVFFTANSEDNLANALSKLQENGGSGVTVNGKKISEIGLASRTATVRWFTTNWPDGLIGFTISYGEEGKTVYFGDLVPNESVVLFSTVASNNANNMVDTTVQHTSSTDRVTITIARYSTITDDVFIHLIFDDDGEGDDTTYELSVISGSPTGSVSSSFSRNDAAGSIYVLSATPNIGYVFAYWEYHESSDSTTWADDDWATYTELTSVNGLVTISEHTQFRAHFRPTAITEYKSEAYLLPFVVPSGWIDRDPEPWYSQLT